MVQHPYLQISKLDTIISHFQEPSILEIYLLKTHISVTLNLLDLRNGGFAINPTLEKSVCFSFVSLLVAHAIVLYATVLLLR
jgi:hypothetical protein